MKTTGGTRRIEGLVPHTPSEVLQPSLGADTLPAMAAPSKQIRWGDVLLIGLSTIVVILLSVNAYGGASERTYALIRNGSSTWRFPLDTPMHADIPGLLGDTLIHISDGKISIEDSPCPTKSCTTMGGISRKGQWLVCMPNGVFITIEGDSGKTMEVDDVSG